MVKAIVGGVTVSWGDYKTKDLCVAIFCYIMIMYTLHKYNDNCPSPEMDKAKIIRFIECQNSKE